MGTAAAPSEDLDATIEASTKAVDTFSEALRVTGFTVPDLVAAGLLPATISWSAVQDARRRVEDAQRRVKEKSANSDWWRVIAANLPLLDIFVSTLRRCGRPLSPAITLALQLQHDLEPPPPLQSLIARLAPFVDFSAVIAGRPIEIPGIEVSASPSDRASDNEKWKGELESLGDKLHRDPRRPLDTLIQPAWDRWGLRIANYLSGRSKADPGVFYEDLLLAAADLPPSNLFRGDIASMTPADWTRLCLRGAKGAQRDAGAENTPGWTCSFALVALGFGPDIIRRVEAGLRPVWDSESLPSSFAERSSAPNVTGRLIIVLDLSQPATASRASARPYLVVDRDLLASYDRALAWLADHGVFDEVIGEY